MTPVKQMIIAPVHLRFNLVFERITIEISIIRLVQIHCYYTCTQYLTSNRIICLDSETGEQGGHGRVTFYRSCGYKIS